MVVFKNFEKHNLMPFARFVFKNHKETPSHARII